MNKTKLKQAEQDFLKKHPLGFEDPEMLKIGKKHKMETMIEQCQDVFAQDKFHQPRSIAENMVKMIGRSSMVSMFEKPKFRDFIPTLNQTELEQLTDGLGDFLYGDQPKGFDAMLDILKLGKLAKWSLMTILPNYVHPDSEVFVKPTTAKNTIAHFDLVGLEYKPQPSWAFYQEYRQQILTMRKQTKQLATPNNAAFCGFLMMSMAQ